MKSFFLILFSIVFLSLNSWAQIPTECFEIESLLVDACGPQEGLNEMVRFQVGPNDMDADNIYVTWATTSLSWEGVIQNGTTASLVNELNATVESCGILIEPAGGILPAGSHVLLATSYLMDPNLNSFANLSDTLYIIFHNDNEIGGHFGNYDSSGTKTFTMAFLGVGGCTDQVEYERNQLIDENGVQTAGNGATVEYDWDGNATYTNNGCVAPITPFGIAITQATPSSICPGENIDLEAVSINGATNAVWSADLGNFNQQNSLTTTYTSPSEINAPFYIYCGLVDACDGAAMDSVLININPTPEISVSPPNASICGNQSVTLTASGGASYTWSTGETGSSIEINAIGTYFAFDNSCGVDTAFAEITLSSTGPTATIDGESSFCFGDNMIITANGGTNYQWQDGSSSQEFTVTSAGTYTVIVSDDCGADTTDITITQEPQIIPLISGDEDFCENESIVLTASGGSAYEWSSGETSNTLTINSAGTYEVEVFSNNCFATTSINVTQHFPSFDFGDDVEACSFDVILSPGSFDQYLWQDASTNATFTVSEPGNYSVIVTDEFGCEASDEITFEVGNLLLDLGEDISMCTGEDITILAPDIVGADYLWQDASTLSSLTVSQSGIYSVEITQGYCQAQDEIEVIAYSPTAFFELESLSGCSPVDVLLQDGSSSPAGIITSWNWNFGDGNSGTSENPFHQYTTEGFYTVSLEITTNDGCSSNFTSGNSIEVYPSPTADFSFVQEQTEDGLVVNFGDQSTDANTWAWDFGDQETSSSQNVIHLYPSPGAYVITLSVSIDNGCSNEISKELFYEPEHFIYIPTAFTPDQDGVNDYFIPVVSGGTISTYELSIFNRLGEKIFFTNDPMKVWLGGNYKADYFTQNDVYNYRLEILFEGEAEKTLRQGMVRIIR